MNVTIRQALVEDAHFLAEAEREIAQEPGFFCSQPFELTDQSVENTILTCLKNPSGLYLVAEHQVKIVAHAFLEPFHLRSLHHIAELTIVVHRGWQKKGIGSQLMQQLIAWAKNSPVLEKIELNVRASNLPAISLYKKWGFQEEAKLKKRVKVQDRYLDDLVMTLDLHKNQEQEKMQVSRIGVYGVALIDQHLLLVTQEKGPYAGKFDLPGGQIEFGETMEQTLRREFQEEVNMTFTSMQLLDNFTATIEFSEAESNESSILHQTGLIYAVSGLQTLEKTSSGALNSSWIDRHHLQQAHVSPFVWAILQTMESLKTPPLPDVVIRQMRDEEMAHLIHTFCFPWSSMQATTEKWQRYVAEQQKHIRTIYLLEIQGQLIGYASLVYQSDYSDFKNKNIPEINDIWISEHMRNQGLGKKLILHLEEIARQQGYKHIGLGVGLYKDYGQAQKLYAHLGYLPDGKGVTYQNSPAVPGKEYPVDDDLILWLTKFLD